MDFGVIVEQMIILFLIVIAGALCGRVGLMDKDFSRKLSGLVINLTCPCLIVASTMGDVMPDKTLILPLLGVSVITYTLLLLLASWLPRIMPVAVTDRGVYSFMLSFSNVGFIGYPIVASMFGAEAVFYASVLNVINTLAVFIWGVQFIAGKGEGKGSFKWSRLYSPAMVATYLSILVVVIGWKAPKPVSEPLSLIGNMTVPAALLIIGNSINNMPLKSMAGSKGVYLMAVLKLFLIPIAMYEFFKLLGLSPLINGINTILIAMPVASFGTMFCLRYGRDDTVITQGTFITTLLSVLSIPIIALFLS